MELRQTNPFLLILFLFESDGKTPRRNGCTTGTVFNEKSGRCDKPKSVPEW